MRAPTKRSRSESWTSAQATQSLCTRTRGDVAKTPTYCTNLQSNIPAAGLEHEWPSLTLKQSCVQSSSSSAHVSRPPCDSQPPASPAAAALRVQGSEAQTQTLMTRERLGRWSYRQFCSGASFASHHFRACHQRSLVLLSSDNPRLHTEW